MIKYIFLLFTFSVFTTGVFAQTILEISFNQPDRLKADAGRDTVIQAGEKVILGGIPSASGGYGDYDYTWLPEDLIDHNNQSRINVTPNKSAYFVLNVTDENNCSDVDTVFITVTGSSNIPGNLNNGQNVIIFPNPFENIFYINTQSFKGDELMVSIYTPLGKKIFSERYSGIKGNIIDVNTKALREGIYFIVAEDKHQKIKHILHHK
jgi:hypothetical protein